MRNETDGSRVSTGCFLVDESAPDLIAFASLTRHHVRFLVCFKSQSAMSQKNPAGSEVAGSVAGYSIGSMVFVGIVATQFLGAFNDNYFKQMVLLKCVELARTADQGLQPLALAAFALPFCLLSGLGGFISDRLSKRTVIVVCKVAEILIMGLAVWVLWPGRIEGLTQLKLLILVLGLMGAQSAIFGPAKYGILPEIFKSKTLLPVNGAVQTTTFLAIIFGMAIAGIAMDRLSDALWICSTIAVGIAVVGTLTALLICPTEIAEPELKMEPGNLFVPKDIRTFLRAQPDVVKAILVMAMFWFIGGVAQPAVNNLGEKVLLLSKTRTSLLAAAIGVGIAAGCVVAGFANRGQAANGARWTNRGSWMIFLSLTGIALLGSGILGVPVPSLHLKQESLSSSLFVANQSEWALRAAMLLLGISAGVFVIPVQVFVQQVPPAELKGRMIGTLNFMTWMGILASAAFLFVMNKTLAVIWEEESQGLQYLTFAALAVFMLPVAVFYRLPSLDEGDVTSAVADSE